MAQGHCQLDNGEQSQGGYDDRMGTAADGGGHRAGWRRRIGAVTGPGGPANSDGPQAPGPVGGEKDERAADHQPGEYAQPGEQQPGQQVKDDQGGIGKGPGAPPEQGRRHGQVEKRAAPAHSVGRPGFLEQGSHQRQVAVLVQPDPQGQSVEQPVGVQLGDAGECIDDAKLGAQGPDGPLRGEGAAGRQKRQQQGGQAHQVVVVEVSGAVKQLNIGEADAEQAAAKSVAIPGGDGDAQ